MTWLLATEGFLVVEDDAIEDGRLVHHGKPGVKAPAGLRHAYQEGDKNTPCGRDIVGLWTEWNRPFKPEPSNSYCEVCESAAKP